MPIALNVIILVFFVVAMLGALAYTVLTTRPRPDREPHGAEVIQEAIDRYDRAQRSGWGQLRFPLDPGVVGVWPSVKRRRRREQHHKHRH